MHPPLKEHPLCEKCTPSPRGVAYRTIKNYVLTTSDGQDLPHFAGFCHLVRFSVK